MKLHYPATARNKDVILEVLRDLLPMSGDVLEIASGSGEHAVHFAAALPGVRWQPSSREEDERASIDAHRAEAGLTNVAQPVALDVHDDPWPVTAADVVFCANMIHIAPWEAAVALIGGASRVLTADGLLLTYGPYRFAGKFTAPSNEAFDASLRSRNAAWGVRDVDDLEAVAGEVGLQLDRAIAMPANNHILVFRRR